MLFSFSGPVWELSQLALHTYFLIWCVRTIEPLVKNGWFAEQLAELVRR